LTFSSRTVPRRLPSSMKKFGGWLGAGKSIAHIGSSKSLTAIDEPVALQDAMRSAALIVNDEVEQAEAELSQGTSPFHKLGHATCMFIRATIGFEKDIMEQASMRLAEAEESASEHQKRAIRDPQTAYQSKIYPAGSEYALVHAEAQLMQAVVGVLNESLTESLRGFYKLRRAFATLQEIIAAENKYTEALKSGASSLSLASTVGSIGQFPEKQVSASSSGVMTPADDSDDEDFQEAVEELPDQATPLHYQGRVDFPDLSKMELDDTAKNGYVSQNSIGQGADSVGHSIDDGDDFATLTSDPIDHFIHSGSALCYGLLQVLLSMIPPAFGKILSILSFRGDRETGFRLLWKATADKNSINGAFAGLIIVGFHNAMVGLCDIHRRQAYPEARLRQLLQDLRTIYPKSILWILEEGRMAALDRRLVHAYDVMNKNVAQSSLRQMNALRIFELGLNTMFRHQYQECADLFLSCIELNNWSHGMYYYIAGCCKVEMYRDCLASNDARAVEVKDSAIELLQKATSHTGKRKFMARQLPLDVFINRKITKWQARAKSKGCDLVEAVGVSPVEEMIYFWAGYKRMAPEFVQTSLARLAWSEQQPDWQDEPIDERALHSLLKATCYRCLGRLQETRAFLNGNVLCYSWAELKACEHADSWAIPVAHFELAVAWWQEAGGEDGDRTMLRNCSDEVAVVENWESYELETRIGMKIKTARVTLDAIGIRAR